MIKNIVFDLGGVLVNWDPIHLYRKIFETEDQALTFLDQVCTYRWNLEQDRGRTLSEATQLKINEFPEFESEIRAYYDRWTEMFDGTIAENVKVLECYRDHPSYRIYALTNWSRETFPIALELFPFFGDFDGVIVSGEEGVIKPDPVIYRTFLDRFNLKAEECVFIDDRLENVEGAKALSFHGIHYQKSEMSLAEELKRLADQ